jgi:hypothetical protein
VNRSDLRLLVGAVLAVVVPAMALEWLGGDARRAAGLTAVPFAFRHLLIAHLIAAVPLGLVVAARFRSSLAASAWWRWAAVGAVTAAAAGAASGWIGEAVARSELGVAPLLLLRTLVAFALVLPWCRAAVDPAPVIRPSDPPNAAIVIGIGLAVIPCGLYTEALITGRTKEAATLLEQKRTAKAEGIVTGLLELGSERPIKHYGPAKTGKSLAVRLAALRRETDRPLGDSPTRASRLNRAALLVELERLDDAAAVLAPLAPGDDAATMMLAAVQRNQRHWAESDALYDAVLAKMLPRARTEQSARIACRTAFEGLASNAESDGRPADAEAASNRGLSELPADASYFHFLLGRHYHDAGRFGLALQHMETATRLDPAGVGPSADGYIRRIRTATPGCLWRGPQ